MAVNMYSNVGFYKAPVCKTLMVYVGCSHAATHIPSLSSFFRKIFSEALSSESPKSILKLVGSKILFPDTRCTILVCFLFYFFRVLERRTGSLKFSSNIVTSLLVSMTLDLALHTLVDMDTWSPYLTPGPLCLILPLFVPYYNYIPLSSGSHMGPFSVSTKSITYLLGLQLIAGSSNTFITSVLYLTIGALVYGSPLSYIRLPKIVGSVCSSLFGWIQSSPPQASSQPMGATLEVQRTQHAEMVEQQLIRARARQFNVPRGGRQMRIDEMWGHGQNQNNIPGPQVQPSPSMIQVLVDMGFPRQRVEQALVRSGNNLAEATNILLNDM